MERPPDVTEPVTGDATATGPASPEPAPPIPAANTALAAPATGAAEAPVAGAGCVPNIGAEGRKIRLVGGGVALFLAVVGSIRILVLRLPAVEMFGPGLAFIAAALGYFQARGMTCVFLAATGGRDEDAAGPKKYDKEQLARIKAQSNRIILQSLGSAAAATAVFVLLAIWRRR